MLLQVCHSEVLYLVSTQSKFMIISYMRLCWVMFHIFTEHHGKWMKILSYFGYIIHWTYWTSKLNLRSRRLEDSVRNFAWRAFPSIVSWIAAGWRSWFCVYFSDQHIYNIYIYIPINIPIHISYIPTVGYHIYMYIYSTSWIYTPQNETLLTSVGDLTKAVKARFVKTWLIYIYISGKIMFKNPWGCFFPLPQHVQSKTAKIFVKLLLGMLFHEKVVIFHDSCRVRRPHVFPTYGGQDLL